MTQTTTTREAIVASSVANGGGTFDPATGESADSGTAVTVIVFDKADTEAELAEAVRAFSPFVADGNYVGTWYDPENRVWEISETAVFADRADALSLAAALAERFVFDIDAQECVAVA